MNNNVIIVNYVGKNEEGMNIPDYSKYNDIINELFNHSDENKKINLMVNGKMILNCKIRGVSVHNGNASIEFTKSNETSINLEFDKYYSRINPDTLAALKNCWIPLEGFIEIADDIIHEVHSPVKEKHECNCNNCKKSFDKVPMQNIKDAAEKKYKNKKPFIKDLKPSNNTEPNKMPLNCQVEMLTKVGKLPKMLRDEILNPKCDRQGIYKIKMKDSEKSFMYRFEGITNDKELLFKQVDNDKKLLLSIEDLKRNKYEIEWQGFALNEKDMKNANDFFNFILKDIAKLDGVKNLDDIDFNHLFNTEWR